MQAQTAALSPDKRQRLKIQHDVSKIMHTEVCKSVIYVHRQTFNSLKTYWLGIGFTAKFIHPLSRAVILFYVFDRSSLHYKHKVWAVLLHVYVIITQISTECH